MSQLIEGFENWSGGLPVGWSAYDGFSSPPTQSTLHVTQGTYSCVFAGGAGYYYSTGTSSPFYIPAGRYSLDYFIDTAAAGGKSVSFRIGEYVSDPDNEGRLWEVFGNTRNTESSLTIDLPESVYGVVAISARSTTSGAFSTYVDNLRYDPIVIVPATKHFQAQKQIPAVLSDTVTGEVPLSSFGLTSVSDIKIVTDVVVGMESTFVFNMFVEGAPVTGDWLPEDWNSADWLTSGSPAGGIFVFVDQVQHIGSPKHFLLSSAANIRIFGDAVIDLPATLEFDYSASDPFRVYIGEVVRPSTTNFKMSSPGIEAYSEAYRTYIVLERSSFDYEILGVNVGTVDGGGRMTVFVDDQIIASDLLFDSDKTNIPLSGIINRGQRLWVGLYMKNGYFRSFDATFALKRDQT